MGTQNQIIRTRSEYYEGILLRIKDQTHSYVLENKLNVVSIDAILASAQREYFDKSLASRWRIPDDTRMEFIETAVGALEYRLKLAPVDYEFKLPDVSAMQFYDTFFTSAQEKGVSLTRDVLQNKYVREQMKKALLQQGKNSLVMGLSMAIVRSILKGPRGALGGFVSGASMSASMTPMALYRQLTGGFTEKFDAQYKVHTDGVAKELTLKIAHHGFQSTDL